jgi:uncharacterized protein YidB (DUF937 family)
MGLLDTVMGAIDKHPEVNQEQHVNLVQTAMQMFGNHQAISGMVNNAQSQGLGHIVQSWISNGPNQSVGPQQVQSIVGQDRINEIASRVGLPPAIASAALSRILPAIVDKLTPEGHLPQAA